MAISKIGNIFGRWNDAVERKGQGLIQGINSCLFSSASEVPQNTLTRFELVLYSFATTLILQGTVGNPLFAQTPIGLVATVGTLGSVALSGVLYRKIRAQLLDLSTLPPKEKLACTTIPLFLLALQVTSLVLTRECFGNYEFITLSLWSSFILIGLTTLFHGHIQQNATRQSSQTQHEAVVSRCTPEETSAVTSIGKLEQEISDLRGKLTKLRKFILANPSLYDASVTALKEDPDGILTPEKSPTQDLDPTNVFDQLKKLMLDRNYLKFQLQEQMLFIDRHPELKTLFEQTLNDTFKKPKETSPLLIEQPH